MSPQDVGFVQETVVAQCAGGEAGFEALVDPAVADVRGDTSFAEVEEQVRVLGGRPVAVTVLEVASAEVPEGVRGETSPPGGQPVGNGLCQAVALCHAYAGRSLQSLNRLLESGPAWRRYFLVGAHRLRRGSVAERMTAQFLSVMRHEPSRQIRAQGHDANRVDA